MSALDLGNNYAHVSGAATTVVSDRPRGILKGIAVNTPIANATVTVRDGDATGPIIGAITLPADVSAMPPSTLLQNIEYATSLTVVTTGVGLDVTVIWR